MSISLVTAGAAAPANVESLRDSIPDYAKDIKLNLGSVLSPEGAADLSEEQIFAIALSSAYAVKNPEVIAAVMGEGKTSEAMQTAAKSAASIMAMNNIYYRFVHLSGSDEIKKMPARLRMNIIGNPGIAKLDFELMCLAVSAINGCGMCIEAHTHELQKAGASLAAIQSAVRIAAVVNAAAQVKSIG